jgi:hypothetical protein
MAASVILISPDIPDRFSLLPALQSGHKQDIGEETAAAIPL